VYTISTAAEPRATRLLPRGLGTEKAGASKGETAGRAGSMNVMLYVANRVSAAPFVRVRPGETMRLTVLREAGPVTKGGMTARRSGSFDTRDAPLSISSSPS
jgi:hypothetical protein